MIRQIISVAIIISVVSTALYFAAHTYFNIQSNYEHKLETLDSLRQVDSVRYKISTEEVSVLRIANRELANLVNKQKDDERAYLKIIAEYRTKLDAIATTDTVFIDSVSNDTVHMRQFKVWAVPEELYLSGMFQTADPYNLSFTDIRLIFRPEVVLTESDTHVWTAFMDTHSGLWKIKDVDLIVREYKPPLMNLHPDVMLSYAWPHELGLKTSVRIWKVYPFVAVSVTETDSKVKAGVGVKIW